MTARFYMPTKVISGRGCIQENFSLCSALGARALLVTGKNSAKINGAQRDVCKALEEQNISFALFDQVESNPSVRTVRDAAEHAKRERADLIIGIGGGSPMDAAKAAAILATNEISDEELLSSTFSAAPLPVVAVPTTAGTGSEVTPYALITNDTIQSKTSVASDEIFPRLAFLDAAYTANLPRHVTVHTALDTLSHAIEGFLSKRATNMSSVIALESMRIIGKCLSALNADAAIGIETREKLLYASMLGGMVITQTGTTAVHALGYSLTYFRNTDHGRANALLLHEYLKFIAADFEDKVMTILQSLGLQAMEEFKVLMDGLLGRKETISPQEITKFSSIALKAKNILHTLRTPGQKDLEELLRKSFA